MAQVPPPRQSPQQVAESLMWKVNNLETKVRINEQNIINDRRHVQLLNRNVLDLKKELRDKLDAVMQQRGDLPKKISDLELKVQNIEAKLKKLVKREEIHALQKFHEHFNYFDKEMSKEEADRILDNIVKNSETRT
ncbi:MAG: hypothetical protein ABIF92_02360 [archaeon]